MLSKSFRFPKRVVYSTTQCFASNWIGEYNTFPSAERQEIIKNTIFPLINDKDPEWLSKDLMRKKGAINTCMVLRDDISDMLSKIPKAELKTSETATKLKKVDKVVQQWLGNSICLDTLELKRITFDHSSGAILEKVARGESVHRVRSLSELKRRLQDGKRCFALFHPRIEADPLVFIHVGLTNELARSLTALDTYKNDETPSHAMFYSVNSPHTALRGLDIASLLIKEVAGHLKKTFPSLKVFSTLSPIPKFLNWFDNRTTVSILILPYAFNNIILLLYRAILISLCLMTFKFLLFMQLNSTNKPILSLNYPQMPIILDKFA